MEDDGTTNINSGEVLFIDGTIEGVDGDFNDGEEGELSQRDTADESTEGDEDGGSGEETLDELGDVEFDLVPAAHTSDFLGHELVEEVAEENPGFNGDAGDHHGVADGGETVLGEEGHQITETDEDHGVDVLEQSVVIHVVVGLEVFFVFIVTNEDGEENAEDDLKNAKGISEIVSSHFFVFFFRFFFLKMFF